MGIILIEKWINATVWVFVPDEGVVSYARRGSQVISRFYTTYRDIYGKYVIEWLFEFIEIFQVDMGTH